MNSELRRRAAFWGNQAGNLDFLVQEFSRPLGEKWPDDEDKEALGELLPVLQRVLRQTRTRYIGVLMKQTAEEAERTEENDVERDMEAGKTCTEIRDAAGLV